jgi:hypothetical protein
MDEMRNVRTLSLAYGSAVVANQIVLQNNIVLVAIVKTREADEEIGYAYYGKMQFPKATGVSFAPGDDCYWDNSAKNITTTAGGNTLCGICLEQNQDADTAIVMMLYPFQTSITDNVAQSKASSAAALVSTAESQAVSVATAESTNKSIADSKAASLSAIASANLSTGNSNAASLAVVDSTNKSISDSKAVSLSTLASIAQSAAVSTAVIASVSASKIASMGG